MNQTLPDRNFFSEASNADMTQATLDESLSHLVVRNEEYFEATVDRLLFKNLLEIITPALEAAGYAANFENILFTLEQTVIGIRSLEINTAGQTAKIKKFLPALFFRLPKRKETGPLLSEFYREINRYEIELKEIKSAKTEKSPQEDPKQLETLRLQNQILSQKLFDLSQHLQNISQQLDGLKKSNEKDALVLPQGLRVGEVLKIDYERQTVAVAIESSQRQIPWHLFDKGLPRNGGHILWNQVLEKVILIEEPEHLFSLEMATVLHVESDQIKCRTQSRKEFILASEKIHLKTDISENLLGSSILLKTFKGVPLGGSLLTKSFDMDFVSPVKEAFLKFDIRDNLKR